jgi:hypothetical protein
LGNPLKPFKKFHFRLFQVSSPVHLVGMAWGKPWIEEEKVLREMSEQGKCERDL